MEDGVKTLFIDSHTLDHEEIVKTFENQEVQCYITRFYIKLKKKKNFFSIKLMDLYKDKEPTFSKYLTFDEMNNYNLTYDIKNCKGCYNFKIIDSNAKNYIQICNPSQKYISFDTTTNSFTSVENKTQSNLFIC